MDSDSPSPRQENDKQKVEFRKLTNEAANRKYRRRSPVSGSSDEDGSPRRGGLGENERRDDNKGFTRHRHDSSRSYHSKNDDYLRHGNYMNEDDKSYAKSSSRGGTHFDYKDRESDYNRSRDRHKDVDKYSRDRYDTDRKYKDRDSDKGRHDGRYGSRYDDRDRRSRVRDNRDDRDEKREYRSYRDHKSDRICLEDSRSHKSDTYSKRESGYTKDVGSSKYSEIDGKDSSSFVSDDLASKKAKFSSDESDAVKDERQTSGCKRGEEIVDKVNGSESVTNVVDAAKVAAMKAAEMVNQNLVGTGFMTADQKKKLLWGSKKNTTTEEPSHRWDTSHFGDRERQEKFNKLMSLRLRWYVWPIVGCEGRCEDGPKTCEQPRCRETKSSVGFRETIYRWSPTKRWSHCWIGFVIAFLGGILSLVLTLNRLYFKLFFVVYLYEICGNLGLICGNLGRVYHLTRRRKPLLLLLLLFVFVVTK